MPLPNITKRLNEDLNYITVSKKDAIFIIPEDKVFRNFKNFSEIKFATIDTLFKPIYAFCPQTDLVNFGNFKAHYDLVDAILKFKYGKNYTGKNIDKFAKNLIFGTYDLNKKKMIFCEESLAKNKNKLKQSVEKILLTRLDKIWAPKNVTVSKKRIFPKILELRKTKYR